jgi:hypothetical protein
MPPHVPYGLRGSLSGCGRSVTDFWGSDAHEVLLRCPDEMDICEYDVPGGALNLSSTKLPRPWSPWESSLSRKNPHCRTGNRTRDLMISSQKLWPLDHEAGQSVEYNVMNMNYQELNAIILVTTNCVSMRICKPQLLPLNACGSVHSNIYNGRIKR